MKTLLALVCAALLTPLLSPAAPGQQEPPQQETPAEKRVEKKARKEAKHQPAGAYHGSFTHKHEFLTDEDDEAARRDSLKAARKKRK